MMKAAIVSMQPLSCKEAGEGIFAPGGNAAWLYAEILQTLALALHMRDSGNFDPCIICHSDGELARQANKLGLPHMGLRNERNIRAFFRLWQWQRKEPRLLVLANGPDSLPAAARLLFMRRRRPVVFVPAFFLRKPALQGRQAKLLRQARAIICGSEQIKTDLAQIMRQDKAKPDPHWIARPAGLDLGQYVFPAPAYDTDDAKSGKHFVFGMAESLANHSGALLVVRAMAALWQTENVPFWEVRMTGSGPRFEEIISEATNLGVLGRLSLLGDQLPGNVCSRCHVWLAPGSASYELPGVMGSAAASGIPLVCVSSPHHRDWLAYMPPNAAIRVEKDNPQELARAMLTMMRDGETRKQYAQISRDCRPLVGVEESAAKICSSLEHEI